jgi:hypothetical protein
MSKCNLKYPGECVNLNPQSRVCEIDHPCEHKPAPEPVPVVPVVRYVKATTYALKIVDGETVEAVELKTGEAFACRMVLCAEHEEISPAEYAAAKSPDHIRGVTEMVRIEPLDPMCGTLERTEKINEIVAWINAKGAV